MELFSKSAARNIFYGGSLVFLLIFLGLTAQSHLYALHEFDGRLGADTRGCAWQAHLGETRLHQLPHHSWRRRLFRAGTGQCLGALWRA